MVEVVLKLAGKELKTELEPGEKLVNAFLKLELDDEGFASCGGNGCCGSCHVKVEQGGEKFGAHTDAEDDLLGTLPDADDSSRMACQVIVDDEHEKIVAEIIEP